MHSIKISTELFVSSLHRIPCFGWKFRLFRKKTQGFIYHLINFISASNSLNYTRHNTTITKKRPIACCSSHWTNFAKHDNFSFDHKNRRFQGPPFKIILGKIRRSVFQTPNIKLLEIFKCHFFFIISTRFSFLFLLVFFLFFVVLFLVINLNERKTHQICSPTTASTHYLENTRDVCAHSSLV